MSSSEHEQRFRGGQASADTLTRPAAPGWPRAAMLMGGGLMTAAGGGGMYGTFVFARLAAWELPAGILMGLAIAATQLGTVLAILGATARTRAQAAARLGKSLLFLSSLGLTLLVGNALLGLLEPDRAVSLKAACPDYDGVPFHSTLPLCETDQPGTSPLEARYPSNQTLQHCTQDFNVTVHTNELGLRSIGREPAVPTTLAIGDSFCFGWGVGDDQTYAAILGWHNAGLWGRPPSTHIKALQWWAPRLRPRRVVWKIYPPHMITELPDAWSGPYQYPGLNGGRGRAVLDWWHNTGCGRFLYQRFGLSINRANYFTKDIDALPRSDA
ncbi:MAG: hypothetical protein V3T70_08200 [Phycisphaerae bacterium]